MAEILHVSDIQIGWRELLTMLLEAPERSPRGLPTREIPNMTIVHHRPHDCLLVGVGRKLSTGLAALEALQLVGGFSDPALTVRVAPQYAQFLDGDQFHGAYGLRTADQIERAIRRIQEDPYTRRAVVTFWNASDDLLGPEWLHDYPCTLTATFAVRPSPQHVHGLLDMTVVMRSNDAWLGYPYDVVQFTSLHRSIAQFLQLPIGTYTHTVHSMHLYADNYEAAREILASPLALHDRPELHGGVGSPALTTWAQVQERARCLVHCPDKVIPFTVEELWMKDVARRVFDKARVA